MKAEIMNTFGKVGFALKKHSPEILAVVGVVGVVTSAVMACKATIKVNDVLDEHKDKMDKVHEKHEENTPELKKETTMVYAQTGMAFVKLYGPSVTLMTLSVGALLGSNQILRKRNSALAAAYMTVDQAFKKYRGRVKDKFGEEAEKGLYFNTKPEEIEEKYTDEKGKTKVQKTPVDVVDPNDESGYVRYLTRANSEWSESTSFINTYLNGQQRYLNEALKAKGYLTLNEAYSAFGWKPSKAGFVVGWIYDKYTAEPTGDNYVQLIVKPVRILNEFGKYEKAYAVDFNVDGSIYNNERFNVG